jgi:hypothetical protein
VQALFLAYERRRFLIHDGSGRDRLGSAAYPKE